MLVEFDGEKMMGWNGDVKASRRGLKVTSGMIRRCGWVVGELSSAIRRPVDKEVRQLSNRKIKRSDGANSSTSSFRCRLECK